MARLDPYPPVRPFGVSPALERFVPDPGQQHPLVTVRLALALAGDIAACPTLSHQQRLSRVQACLNEHDTSVLVLDRITGDAFLAHLPGPGSLATLVDHHLLLQLADIPDWFVLPFDGPNGDASILLFENYSMLSSCRDYCILGTACLSCQELRATTSNLCLACAEALAQDAAILARSRQTPPRPTASGEMCLPSPI